MRVVAGVAIVLVAVLAAEPVRSAPPVASIAEQFLSRQNTAPISFRSVRRLEASNEKRRVSGWLEAVTELDPVSGFQYRITAEGGSDYIRNKVLRQVLATEQKTYEGQTHDRTALTTENYTFGEAAPDDSGFLLVPITPKRRAEMLVDGVMVLGTDAELVRVEGRLTKNPSFWTRRVEVVRRYSRVNGVRVPVEMSSTAHVLVVGLSTFSMCIDYETINGEPADMRTSCS